MKCPTCQHPKSEVLRVRDTNRRRQCLACGFRWTTVEQPAVELAALVADTVRRIPKPAAPT